MSYDAEVEKNKKLMKTVEELRFKKQDLKTTLAKMQKAFERNTNRWSFDNIHFYVINMEENKLNSLMF